MKSFLSAVFIFVVMVFNSRAVTYTNGFICGSNLISNPLGVGIYTLIPYPQEFLTLIKWNQANESFDEYYAWFLGAWSPGDPTLARGESAVLVPSQDPDYTFHRCPPTNTVTGTQIVPVLPIAFTRNTYRALSRQNLDPGSYENIVGLPPEKGSKFIRYERVTQAWVTNTFNGVTWSGGATAATMGEGVLIYFPPLPLVLTNLVYSPGGGGSFAMQVIGTSNVLTRVQCSTNLNSTNWFTVTNYAPPTGTFHYTTNGVGTASVRFYRATY